MSAKIVSFYSKIGYKLSEITIYKYGKTLLCNSGDAARLLGVSRSTKDDYFKRDGIEPIHECKDYRNHLFDLRHFMHRSKIIPMCSDVKMSDEEVDDTEKPLDEVSINEAKRRAEIERVKNLQLKNAELAEQLIPAEIVDRELAFQAALHISLLRNEKTVFPNLLESKSREEIESIISDYQKDEIDRLQNILKKKKAGKLGTKEVSELIYAVLERLNDGETVDTLMEAIGCSQE